MGCILLRVEANVVWILAGSKVPKTRAEKRAARKLEVQQAKKDQERAERRHEEGMQRSLAKRISKQRGCWGREKGMWCREEG